MEIFNWKSVEINKFSIRSSNKVSLDSFEIPIEYNKKCFITQTPKYMVIKKPSKYFLLCYPLYKFNTTNSFIEKILFIERQIFTYISQKEMFKTFQIRHSINDYKNSAYFYTNFQTFNKEIKVSIYDHNQTKQNINYIITQSYGKSLIYLKNIWCSKGKIGFNWINLQCKIYKPFIELNECLIVEDQVITDNKNYEKDYEKFFKMHKFGVPIPAIKKEILKNNLDINIFMKKINSTNKILIEKKNIETPKPISFGRPKINANMLLSVKLKKSKKKEKKKIRKKDKILKGIDTKKYRPPSAKQLQKILKNLKKH